MKLEIVSFVFFLFICGRFEKAILLPVASNPHSFESHRLCQLYFYPATNCIFILTKMYFIPLTGCFSTCQRLYFAILVFSSIPKFSSKDVFLPSNRLHFNLCTYSILWSGFLYHVDICRQISRICLICKTGQSRQRLGPQCHWQCLLCAWGSICYKLDLTPAYKP